LQHRVPGAARVTRASSTETDLAWCNLHCYPKRCVRVRRQKLRATTDRMNHQNSPWASDGGFQHHHQQAAPAAPAAPAGTGPTPTPGEQQQRQGWLMAEQPAGVGGWGGSSGGGGGGNQAFEDAMDRFGGMTLGSN
ncbi:unnamed protein product, partial [Ectocarpus fasciculatus]